MATYQQHVDGVLEAFNAGEKVAYMRDALPHVLPPEYVELIVARRFGGIQRDSGEFDGRLMRIVARAVGKTLAGTYRMWDLIDSLEGVTVTVGGIVSTPITFETDDELIQPDAGWYSGAKSLAYALF